MPLGKEVGLSPGHIVLDGDPVGPMPPQQPVPTFGPCLLWPNGRPSQLLLSSCYCILRLAHSPHHLDRFWRSIRHMTCFHAGKCLLRSRWDCSLLRAQIPQNAQFLGREYVFSSQTCEIEQHAYYQNYIISIPTKFCTVIKTTKCPSWVVRTHASQIQDGGSRHFGKIKKSPYLSNRLTDRHEIWYCNTCWPAVLRCVLIIITIVFLLRHNVVYSQKSAANQAEDMLHICRKLTINESI